MTSADDPVRFAADVAPVVDAAVVGVHRAAGTATLEAVRRRHGYRLPLGVLLELRVPLLRGPVPADGVAAVFRFRPNREALIAEQVAGGWLATDGDGRLALSPRGRALLVDALEAYDGVLGERWAHRAADHDRVRAVVEEVVAAADTLPGGAFALWRRPPVPEPGGPAARLWNRLVAMRYHRVDAHAAAGAAFGLTPLDLAEGRAGDRAGDVEHRTNVLSAGAWAALAPGRRARLLDDLRGYC